MKECYKAIYRRCRAGEDPEPLFRSWISWALRSWLEPFKHLIKSLRAICPAFLQPTGLMPAMHPQKTSTDRSKAAIIRARGFQSIRSLTNIIFLSTGSCKNLPANPFADAVA
jgi:hypothetical protein